MRAIARLLRAAADGHVLDEAHVDRSVEGQAGELEHVLPHAPHHDRVDLHGFKAVFEGGVDARERLLHTPQARDLRKALGVEGVERDVDAVEAGVAQGGGQARQERPVGGERDVLDARDGANLLDERHDAMGDERLAAGEPHARDALLGDEANEVGDLLGGEQLAVRTRRHALFGLAVHTAEIALIRNGYAQVVYAAAKAVV